jgi:hypothetical protein
LLIVTYSPDTNTHSYHYEKGVPQTEKLLCPCCDYRTLDYLLDICDVCCWQHDGQGDEDQHDIRREWNYELSLYRARRNYVRFGAAAIRHRSHVRPPRDEEMF